jgi:hypothetical protein
VIVHPRKYLRVKAYAAPVKIWASLHESTIPWQIFELPGLILFLAAAVVLVLSTKPSPHLWEGNIRCFTIEHMTTTGERRRAKLVIPMKVENIWLFQMTDETE